MAGTAVIFPGLGYNTDRPLLYFASRLALAEGYEIIKIEYPGCSRDLLKADKEVLKEYSETCVRSVTETLKKKGIDTEEDILFISKSIGTGIAAAAAGVSGKSIRHIYFTPLEAAFEYVLNGSGIAFNGTKDSWADWKAVAGLCKEKNIPLMTVEDADHSIETGNVPADIENLQRIMTEVKEYISKRTDN